MKITAKNNFAWIIRDETETEKNGFQIPDSAQKKPNTGKIISVGSKRFDKTIKDGQTAVFNKQVGQELSFEGTDYTILNSDNHILGCLE